MPLANDFVVKDGDHQGFTPMEVLFCPSCTLAQLSIAVDPNILYANYAYVTSSSQTMQRHFDRLTKDVASENGKGTLLEVGSNDGRFLRYAASSGFTGLVGIDPAENLAWTISDSAKGVVSEISEHIQSIVGFFGPDIANSLPFCDTIVARHCFCHQEWRPFMEAVTRISTSKTLVCIEVPYTPDLLRRTEFDSIYQEHTSYLTLKSVVALLKNYPFHLHHVIRYGIHGGCVLLMLRHNDSGIVPHLSAEEALHEENVTAQDWKDFSDRANSKVDAIRIMVGKLRSEGKIVSAFGASAKASVLLNACGFTNNEIKFVTDNTPHKPGKLVPGTDIPVIEESEMLSEHPDYAIMTAWNYEKEIREKMVRWTDRGGKFIIPGESLSVV